MECDPEYLTTRDNDVVIEKPVPSYEDVWFIDIFLIVVKLFILFIAYNYFGTNEKIYITKKNCLNNI